MFRAGVGRFFWTHHVLKVHTDTVWTRRKKHTHKLPATIQFFPSCAPCNSPSRSRHREELVYPEWSTPPSHIPHTAGRTHTLVCHLYLRSLPFIRWGWSDFFAQRFLISHFDNQNWPQFTLAQILSRHDIKVDDFHWKKKWCKTITKKRKATCRFESLVLSSSQRCCCCHLDFDLCLIWLTLCRTFLCCRHLTRPEEQNTCSNCII